MAVVTQKWSNRPLAKTPDGYEAELVWEVTGVSTQQEAIAAVGVAINTSHPASSSLRCNYISADTPRGPMLWEVRARFATGTFGDNTAPLSQPMRLRWRPGNITEPIGKDRVGKPILNSANTAFATNFTKPYSTLYLTVHRNEPFYNIQKALTYRNRVNKDQFNVLNAGTVEPGQCMCLDIYPTHDYPAIGTVSHVEVAYEFEFRDGKHPFQPRGVDQGPTGYYSDGGTVRPGNFTDGDGTTLVTDVMLDGTGKPIDPGVRVTALGRAPVAAPIYRGGGVLDPDQSTATAKVFRFDTIEEVNMANVFS